MDAKQMMYVQKKVTTFHRLLFLVIIIFQYQFEWSAANPAVSGPFPSCFLLVVMLMDLIITNLAEKKLRRGILFARVIRYLQIIGSLYLMIRAQNKIVFGVAVTCFMLFSLELFFIIDYSDALTRNIFYMLVGTPLFSCIFVRTVEKGSFDSFHLDDLVFYSLLILLLILFGSVLSRVALDSEQKYFAQTNLLDDAKSMNEKLVESQKKVKETNDLLGAQAIQLKALNRQINSVNTEMTIQNDILKYISSSLEIDNLMNVITEAIQKEIDMSFCGIMLLPEAYQKKKKKCAYRLKCCDALDDEIKNGLIDAMEQNQFTTLFPEDEVFVDNHIDADSSYPFFHRKMTGSMIIMPLIREGQRIGAFFAGKHMYDYFSENKSFFEGIITQFMIAMNNAYMYMKMEDMAIRDGLTGIFNRRHLTECFNKLMNNANINKHSLSVALFDIDHFKNVNDTYGHLCGDVVIKSIANFAADTAEEYDGIVGRYGGEEFVIIFPDMNLEQSLEPVRKMQQLIRENVIEYDGKKISVRVSVGLTSYPETCQNPGELLNRADWAMYYSKQNGRDRITIDSDEIREQVMLK